MNSKNLCAIIFSAGLGVAAVACADEQTQTQQDKSALIIAMNQNENIAKVSTSTETAYSAFCKSAEFAFKLAEQCPEQASEYSCKGYKLADAARKINPNRVEAQYDFALCMGIYLRENTFAGISKLDELIDAAKCAAKIDETYDHGGPHRILARIYSEAPRYIGPGDYGLAREHVQKLLEIAGDDVENELVAVRVYFEIGDTQKAKEMLAKTKTVGIKDAVLKKEQKELEELIGKE